MTLKEASRKRWKKYRLRRIRSSSQLLAALVLTKTDGDRYKMSWRALNYLERLARLAATRS